jgi:hypothetical protein
MVWLRDVEPATQPYDNATVVITADLRSILHSLEGFST